MLSKSQFIEPCLPTLRKEPPDGVGWTHEVKFDGYRVQILRDGANVAIYSRNGHDFTDRYPRIARDILKIPTKQFIIDAELTACDGEGNPDFGALLMGLADEVCIWVFDILSYRGKDIRHLPLITRQYSLDRLMGRSGSPLIQKSEPFSNPHTLLAECARRKFEGIVSKRAGRPYISGRSKDWIKVKCAAWREANKWRHEIFDKRR